MYAWQKHQVSGNRLSITTSRARELKATRSSPRRSLPMPRNALGRGLGALIRESEPKTSPDQTPPHATTVSGAASAPSPRPHPPLGLGNDLPAERRVAFRSPALGVVIDNWVPAPWGVLQAASSGSRTL